MTRRFRFFAGVFLGIWLWVGPVVAGQPVQVLGVRQVLPNGLVWLFSEQTSLPLVTLNLLIKGGTLRDPPGKEGLANLTALLLTQGTKTRTATQIAQEVDFLGARLSAAGQDDFALISLTVLKKDLLAGLTLFKDVLLHPTFAPGEVRRKVSQLQASFKTDEDEPGVVAARAFDRRLFGANPYGHPPKGTPKGLAAITPKDLAEFHSRFYRPNNAILSLAGDLSRKEAEKLVTQFFGAWEPAPLPELKLPAPPPLKGPELEVIDKNITQANIIWGHLGIARGNPDFYAFQVMNYILGGGGFASRLMDNIREKRGLAYSVGSGFDPGLEPGSFTIILETKNATAVVAVEQALKEVERLRTQPVSQTELEEAKSYLIGSFSRKMDSLGKRAGLMGYVELYGLGLDYPWRYADLIRDLTPAAIQKVAAKYLHPDRYLLVVVGNQKEMPNFQPVLSPQGTKEKKDVSQ
ncbi:MAG: pitrilysin family protein [Thermodesulfobacteriota bacterium]